MRRSTPARAVLARALVSATAVALLAGLSGVPAEAAPSAAKVAAAATVTAPEATVEDKYRAAAVLGINAGDDLLVLTDRNFVIALWRRATGTEVRASAELAFEGTDLECAQWIKAGLQAAKIRDDNNELRDKAAADAARDLKQHAAATIGISAEPELLIQSYRDFTYALWQRATGPKVKAAALTAFGGSEADQKEFLLNGIVAAHSQDMQDAIDADHNATEAQKAAQAARNAKANAAAVLGIVATDSLLVQPDDNFVREILNRAVPGSEIAAAAESALRSSNPADWKAFIDTGIYAAKDRDRAIANQKQADADRKRLTELKVKATNSGMNPTLVAAATVALAGTVDDISRFLRVGQYDPVILRQSLQADTLGVRGSYIRGAQGAQAVIGYGNQTPQPGDGVDATWEVEPGLADPTCFSFESVTNPDTFLRQHDFKVFIQPSDGTDTFRADATWCTKPAFATGGVSLESKTAPGRLLRHYGGQLFAADKSGSHPFDAANLYDVDTFWRIHGENPTTTKIGQRWLNDDVIRARLGDAIAEEKVDGALRYRDYQKGRLSLTTATGVKEMEGDIFAEYVRTDVQHSTIYGAPSTDETGTPDGIGRYNHFAGGGSIYWTAATGAHLVYGGIKDRWVALGWEKSYLGYPTANPYAVAIGQCSNFQHGSITWNSTTSVMTDAHAACAAPKP